MNAHLWWYLSRATGLVAFGLLTASVAFGLTLSTRLFGRTIAPVWLTELHRFLGALSVIATGAHIATLLADSYVQFRLIDFVVPFAARWKPGALAWGVVAFWLLLAIEVTSLMMKRIPRKLWRMVHMTSFALFGAAVVHGLRAGTDGSTALVQTGAIATVMIVLFLGLVRLLAPRGAARRNASRPAAAVATPTS